MLGSKEFFTCGNDQSVLLLIKHACVVNLILACLVTLVKLHCLYLSVTL